MLDLAGVGLRITGLGWATVDRERAATELGAADGLVAETDREIRDDLLGAWARVIAPSFDAAGMAAGIALVVLEPSTEGRLAASLARRGEGPVALYLVPTDADLSGAIDRLGVGGIGTRLGRSAFGPGAVILGRRPDEPQVLLVAVPSEP